MLCGQGVVAIWNGITEEGRADFYAWHVQEHMPERVGIPGFLRGRRYRALGDETRPEFFTLYEASTFEVLVGQDYANRLAAPTPWTKAATAHFLTTSRALSRVIASVGPGMGGVLATIRFRLAEGGHAGIVDTIRGIATLPEITGAHFCRADGDASNVRTAETRGRSDIDAPPDSFALIEACQAQALAEPIAAFCANGAVLAPDVGRYMLEYCRQKTDWAAA